MENVQLGDHLLRTANDCYHGLVFTVVKRLPSSYIAESRKGFMRYQLFVNPRCLDGFRILGSA